MSWSFPLFTLGGTVVRIHLTFFLLLAWVAAVMAQQGGTSAAIGGVVFVLLVFVCVVAHEFGHVFAARRYGIRTPDITVLPIGGLARFERMPDKPGPELIVALAGPAVNFVIAGVLIGVVGARLDSTDMSEIEQLQMSLPARLAAVNIIIAAFNLLPAFPLDGGRVFRALLSFRFDRPRATRIAAWTGQVFAVIFVVIGLLYNPILALIGVFMFFAGQAESGYESAVGQATGRTAADAMVSRFESLEPEDSAGRAGDLLLLTTQQQFPVLGDGAKLVGWVTRDNLVSAMSDHGPRIPVSAFMEADSTAVSADTPLEEIVTTVQQSPARAIAVHGASGAVQGFVNWENVTELFMLDRARRSAE